MSVLNELLQDVSLPAFYLVKQEFEEKKLDDLSSSLVSALCENSAFNHLRPGMRIAITAGSRGVRNMAVIIKEVVAFLKSKGTDPFIIPAMGSHGGAKAEGQKMVLESMGITEEFTKAPILSSMEAKNIGITKNGVKVFMDRFAYDADGIIVINRIKPHVGFRGPYESGVTKMIAIGLGKQLGAEACHASGFGNMARNIPEVAKVSLTTGKIIAGIGILENAFDETLEFHVMKPNQILELEPSLQDKAKQLMPKFYIDQLDVLVVEEIGKNITGTGMDTNIIGRYHTPFISGGPTIKKIVVNSLTPESHGNANGIGLADFTTRAFFDDMSFEQTYPNSLTSTVQDTIKVPMVLENATEALKGAIKTCGNQSQKDVRIAYVKNTLQMDEVFYSEALLKEILSSNSLGIQMGPMSYQDAQDYFKAKQNVF